MMLKFENITYGTSLSPKDSTIKDLSFDLKRGQHLSLFCTREETANSLLNLILGNVKPKKGAIIREGSMSSPIGQYSWFHAKMTCRENIHFVCQIYGKNSSIMCEKVYEYTDKSINLDKKFGTLKTADKRKITLALALFFKLDIYTIKTGTGHPDKKFQTKFNTDFDKLLDESATAITVSSDIKYLRKTFKHSIFINATGSTEYFANLDDAVEKYKLVNQQKRT